MLNSPRSPAFIDAEMMSRPSAKYLLYYPLILASAAILLWIFPTDAITAFSTAVATVISCAMMWEYLFTNQVIRLSRVCSMGLVIGYGAGTFNTWLTLARGSYPLAVVMGQTVPEMANGVATALMGCSVLLMLGELFEKPIFTTATKFTITKGLKRIVLICFLIVAAGFASGKFKQGGVALASAGHAGVLNIFLSFLLSPTVVIVTIIFLVEQQVAQKYIFGVLALFLWVVELTQGRRELVYPALVTVGLARYAGYKWSQLSIGRIFLVAFGLIFLFIGVLTYQLMRMAGYTSNSRALTSEASQVGEWVQQGRAWQMATTSSANNVKTRTLIVTFLGDILYREKISSPTLGKDLVLQTETAIPSIIDRNKPDMAEEDLASQAFGVHYPDQPNSIFTLGAVDLGVWGVMIYPIVIILLFSAFIRISYTYLSSEVFLYGLATFVFTSMQAEMLLTGYLMAMRNLLTFALLLYLILKMPSLRMSGGNVEHGLLS